MTNDKCPRCGHQRHDPVGTELLRTRHHDPMVESWYCGTYREESGNIYESELCETRQELEQFRRELHTVTTEKIECARRAEKAEAELDRAHALIAELQKNLAEWLKNREKANE